LRHAELSSGVRGLSRQQLAQLPALASDKEMAFSIVRAAAATSVNFKGHVLLHRPTTGHIDARALWSDNPPRATQRGEGGPYAVMPVMCQTVLFSLRAIAAIAVSDSGAAPGAPMPVELGDEQGRQLLDAKLPKQAARLEEKPVVASYDFGDTRARVIDITLDALSRHADQFGADARHSHVRSAPSKRVIVAGSARPHAPKVEYVIPIYNWSSTWEPQGRTKHTRQPGWFRIWLGPDWYSAGNGELLALLCWPSALLDPVERGLLMSRKRVTPGQFTEMPEAIEPYVTRWGLDPLAQQDIEFGNMPASALTNRLRSLEQMRREALPGDMTLDADLHHLQDMPTFEPLVGLNGSIDPSAPDPGDRVALALYRPACDPLTGRWYVDLQIAPGQAYCPFVRLALARYQAHALPGLRLSEVVTTEFVQLLPERSATVIPRAPGGDKLQKFDVVLGGASLGDDANRTLSMFHVHIEQKQIHAETWVPVPATETIKTASSMTFDDKAGNWICCVDVHRHMGHQYSLVIEEHERFGAGIQSTPARLVYYDRIGLFA
jgi:hypothetical protein